MDNSDFHFVLLIRYLSFLEDTGRFVQQKAKDKGVNLTKNSKYNLFIGKWLDLDTLTEFLRILFVKYGNRWPNWNICATRTNATDMAFPDVEGFARAIHGVCTALQ